MKKLMENANINPPCIEMKGEQPNPYENPYSMLHDCPMGKNTQGVVCVTMVSNAIILNGML